MAATRRRRGSTLATLLVALPMLAGIGLSAFAQDARLMADCAAPKLQSADPVDDIKAAAQPQTYSLSCDVHVTDAVTVQSVKATLKGKNSPLEATYVPFDIRKDTLSVMFLIQIVEPGRYRTAQLIADTVLRISEGRDGNRRYAAYSFANDLNLLAGFDASKADFDKAVRSVRSLSLPTQLYQTALEAVEKLAKEPSTRKALVILGDGNSDDTGYTHEQVVAAAKQAGIVIHTLGFVEVASEMPRFQLLRRLAEDTGGYRREVRQARVPISPRFGTDVLENGGVVTINLKEPPGTATLALQADLGAGRVEAAEQALTLPAPPVKPPVEVKPTPPPPLSWEERVAAWIKDNRYISYALGLGLLLASLGFLLFAFGKKPAPGLATAAAGPAAGAGKPKTVYGWLEMLDGNTTKHPLEMTNVRIGRHRDNDVCLQNETISRRHAVLHFNADHKRFVITDLGTENGVVVNKVRQKSHELTDGDLIELGEVRLRFRANVESVGLTTGQGSGRG